MVIANGPTPAAIPPADSSEPMFSTPADEPAEVAALKAQGYVILPPMVAS